MEEMMEDTLATLDDDEELEEEADAEVDAVLFNITEGKLGKAGTVTTELPVSWLIRGIFVCSNWAPTLSRLPKLRKTRQRPKPRWLECKNSSMDCSTHESNLCRPIPSTHVIIIRQLLFERLIARIESMELARRRSMAIIIKPAGRSRLRGATFRGN